MRNRLFGVWIAATLVLIALFWWRGEPAGPDPTGGARALDPARLEQLRRGGRLSDHKALYWHVAPAGEGH